MGKYETILPFSAAPASLLGFHDDSKNGSSIGKPGFAASGLERLTRQEKTTWTTSLSRAFTKYWVN